MTIKVTRIEDYPLVLTASHIAEIIGVSKRVAYNIMELSNFPLIRIGRCKRVTREALFKWLNEQYI
ncbi:helix-turn-helix domain-containing protein [Brevibacillus sp. M2.1A]|uniref:helix-turn-helix domain-containing protein n=1 Tax=Brevibacillus TaxID=55080 RepID=UPI00156ABC9B|nr:MULTISPECIES: helix-turn-helix domain-containing protein [unclassified Brevibacillus]MCC8434477.1 helix-turn-helix domain-containing protein [Brevibacillus sp. M2.1A]MCE0452656.1 helix-turn-helix domain-containing protein [Brevibacillus sp. AF8]